MYQLKGYKVRELMNNFQILLTVDKM